MPSNFIDEDTMLAACDELELVRPQQDQGQGRRAAHAKSRKQPAPKTRE